jgi:hypothetical protein
MRAGLLATFLAVGVQLFAQDDPFADIRPLHASLATCAGEDCLTISTTLAEALEEGLSAGGAFEAWPASTDFMASVQSSDGRVRVYTWNWPHPDRTSGYGGLVIDQNDEGELRFTRLLDPSSADRPSDQQNYSPDQWRGALYYAMVPDAVDKNTYLLLGWDDADAQVTRKIIEPLQLRSRGLRFGAPVLKTPLGMARRHVLEYADAAQASLRHQPATKGRNGQAESILFDHLAPREPHLTGITAYYGPDMTFDAFVPGKKGKAPWVLMPNVDAIQALPQDRPFKDPRPRNRRRNRR